MNHSKLLINEPPLEVLPSLAARIGLNEAVVLQQVHYWLQKSKNERDGRKWAYNTYTQWQEQFPFWSYHTIQRIFLSLEKKGLIISAKFNAKDWDQRKWYSIDYEVLNDFFSDDMSATKVAELSVRQNL